MNKQRLKIAVAGSGIAGLSAAWLLGQAHDVTLYEEADRLGGHSNTVNVSVGGKCIPVDTGFIVFNRFTYPNLTALFAHLGVTTERSDMSFAVSLDDGDFEYAGGKFSGLLAQRRNVLRARFWSMLRDILKFYRSAAPDLANPELQDLTLGEYLEHGRYSTAFRDDHLLPMAGAIWSSIPTAMLSYPAASLIRFHHNHGLMKISGRPTWETVSGGSSRYVAKLIAEFSGRIRLGRAVVKVVRSADGVAIEDSTGQSERFDHLVFATHADQALKVLDQPSEDERALLGAFKYQRNLTVLHSDASFMPKRRAAWSSWNYLGARNAPEDASFTYWMNRLQNLPTDPPLFVTLNPHKMPEYLHYSTSYDHPVFDRAAIDAQTKLWRLQGRRRTWFCGAHFGYGFHEDGLQSGLAVAEALGGVRRPWVVTDESGRIALQRRVLAEGELVVNS